MCPTIYFLGFEIQSYYLFYIIAALFASFLLRYELKRNNYQRHLYLVLIFVGIIAGIIGSKLYYIFESWQEVMQSPFENIFKMGGSGWYGGFLLGSLAILITFKIKKLPIFKTLDIIIPAIPLAQFFGRMGCFMAGCCHGIPTTAPWAMSFRNGLFSENVKVHPTQLYEMLIAICLFILLWRLRKKKMVYGTKISIYLIFSGLGRFIVEFFRLNPKVLLNLTAPQIFSILGLLLGISIIFFGRDKNIHA